MKIAILGTGMVGETVGRRLVELGHEVKLGSRTATNEKASVWAKAVGPKGSHGTFEAAAAFGEVVFNCTSGDGSVSALRAAAESNLAGKVLIDVSNPLDKATGFPPSLSVSNTDSLGEVIQRTFPKARVVKALNTMSCNVMVNPRALPESTSTFLSGNDSDAKAVVRGLLGQFGWRSEEIIDLGDITTSRGPEMWLPLWLRLYGVTKTGTFNIKVVK